MRWPGSLSEAGLVQEALRENVIVSPLKGEPAYVAGADAAFADGKIIGVVSLYKYPELTPLEDSITVEEVLFPYVPGYLSFREGPALIHAVKKLKIRPDLIIFDGQGIAHPKMMGIASHIGVVLGIPSIGCAKSRLVGEYEEPGVKKGDWSPLNYNGKIVGAVLRTRDGIRPVFVSPGHMIDLKGSVGIALKCTGKYRIPEPLRRADMLSKKVKKELGLNESHGKDKTFKIDG